MSILAPNRKPLSRYQPRVRAERGPPLPPQWRPPAMWERHGPDPAMLARFLVLSMLVHLLGILLFGAPAGGSREGRAMFGSSSLEVVIRDPFRAQEPAPALRFERGLGSLRPSPQSARPRAVESAPQASPEGEPLRDELSEAAAPRPAPPILDRLEKKAEPPAFEVPPPSERIDTPRIERPLAEPPKIDAPPPPPKPIDVPRIELPVAPRIERQLLEPPKIESPPPPPKPVEVPRIEAPAVPNIDRKMLEPPKIEVPAPARPIEIPRIEAPIVPRIERQLAEPPRIEAPLVLPPPAVEVPRLERVVPQRIERTLAEPPRIEAPVVRPEEAAPPQTPPVDRAPVDAQRLPATRPDALRAPDAQRTPSPAAPAARSAPPAPATSGEPVQASPASPARRDAPVREPAIETPSPFRSAPAPRTGSDYDPTAPALDLDALRKRAGELTRAGTGNRAALPFPMPPLDKPKTKMEDAIEKARKPDCRTAYQSLGLAAVVPLIANEFGEGNCRW